MKKMMKINKLEEMANDEIGVCVIEPTKMFSRLRESLFHIDYQMHKSIYLSIDLEIKVEGLHVMKCTKIQDHMMQWDELLLKKD